MSKIASIRHQPDIRPVIQYPVFKMAGYPGKLLSGPSLIGTKKISNMIRFIKLFNSEQQTLLGPTQRVIKMGYNNQFKKNNDSS